MADETKTEDQAAPVVDHGFARGLLGANGFKRIKGTHDYERWVMSLTYVETFIFRITHVGANATLTVTRKSDGREATKTGHVAAIYTDAIALAHTLS